MLVIDIINNCYYFFWHFFVSSVWYFLVDLFIYYVINHSNEFINKKKIEKYEINRRGKRPQMYYFLVRIVSWIEFIVVYTFKKGENWRTVIDDARIDDVSRFGGSKLYLIVIDSSVFSHTNKTTKHTTEDFFFG